MVTHLAPSVVNTLTRPDPARVYRTCTKRISLESSLKELSFKTITKSMGVSMKELWTEMRVLKKWYQRPFIKEMPIAASVRYRYGSRNFFQRESRVNACIKNQQHRAVEEGGKKLLFHNWTGYA